MYVLGTIPSAIRQRAVVGSVCYPSIAKNDLILTLHSGKQKQRIDTTKLQVGRGKTKNTKVKESSDMKWTLKSLILM